MVVLEVVAVGEACNKYCRRRGRSSISSPDVHDRDCRLERRLPEHIEDAPNVHVVVLEEMTKAS